MPTTATAPAIDVRDECRESELTPGEAHAAYLELNGQITVHLDAYVEQRVNATNDFKDVLTPLLDQMQSMLSKRGSRKLLSIAGVPTWEVWFEDFEKRLQLGISLRTIQRWLKDYRERDSEKPEPDINVIAKESIRHVESKKQLEKLQSAVKERNQLNPAIRSELVRALKARAKAYLSLAAKLEKGAGR
jgi:DNA-binding transcriptional MerR regulator